MRTDATENRLRNAQGQLTLLTIVRLCKVWDIESRYQIQTPVTFEQVRDE